MADLAVKYRRLFTTRKTLRIDIWFLHNCLREHVTPVFARVKTSRNVPHHLRINLEIAIIRKNICKHYAKLDLLNCRLKNIYDQLVASFDGITLDSLMGEINYNADIISSVKFRKVNKKLDCLIKDRLNSGRNRARDNGEKYSDFKFHERVKNLSQITFDEFELEVLNMGLKHGVSVPLSEQNLLEYAVELDVLVEHISRDYSVKKALRNDLYNILYNFKKNLKVFNESVSATALKTLKNLKSKIKHNNLIISKADKGNCLVILRRDEYIEKVEKFLSDNEFSVLPSDPFNTFVNRTKRLIGHFSDFLNGFNIPNKLISSNPTMPRLYGLPKLHKVEIPIRPVVSFTNTPISILAKVTLGIINELTNFRPRYGVKNSRTLVNTLQTITLPERCLMVSFDVTNLFTSVPKSQTVDLVGDLLRANEVGEESVVNVCSLLNICLSQDFFKFNERFYRQPGGLAMGNCLSPFLADLFMHHLETNHILPNNPEILHWFRYVDDGLAFLSCDTDGAQFLLRKINCLHPNIKFTLELEVNSALNFLDLTVKRTGAGLSFSIYRKPTQTDHTISFYSNHSFQHKMASFNCYIHRLLNVPMSKSDYNTEVKILKQIAYNNSYDPALIDTLIAKAMLRKLRSEAYHSQPIENFYVSVPFVTSGLSRKIVQSLREFVGDTLRVSHKTSRSLNTFLSNSKDPIPELSKSGIYKLNCGSCDSTYIGRTCRPLKVRINEHLTRSSSVFGEHLRSFQHSFSPHRDSKILKSVSSRNFTRLDFLEDIEINKEVQTNENCLNIQTSLGRSFIPLHKRLS